MRCRRRCCRRADRGGADAVPPRRALRATAGRRRLDPAAGAQAVRRRQDAGGPAQAPRTGRRRHRRRRAACRMKRGARRRRSQRRCSGTADLVIVFGASAIADRRDVIPAAIEAAGGRVEHFGMPVDPGNLLLLGALRRQAGASARRAAPARPKENGFDWVLQRLLAGLARDPRRHRRHGRRRPSDGDRHAAAAARTGGRRRRSRVAALVLAAGRVDPDGRAPNKLLATLDGKPLVRHAVKAAAPPRRARVGGHRPSRGRSRKRRLRISPSPWFRCRLRRRPLDLARGRLRRASRGRATAPSSCSGTCRG